MQAVDVDAQRHQHTSAIWMSFDDLKHIVRILPLNNIEK